MAKRAEESLARIILGNRTISSGYWGAADPWVVEFVAEPLALGDHDSYVEATFRIIYDEGESSCTWTATAAPKVAPKKRGARATKKFVASAVREARHQRLMPD